MPVRYSSQRVQISSLAKCKCVLVVREGCVQGDSYDFKYEDVPSFLVDKTQLHSRVSCMAVGLEDAITAIRKDQQPLSQLSEP
eukprot:5482269-Karenia_brevis.AAC.1